MSFSNPLFSFLISIHLFFCFLTFNVLTSIISVLMLNYKRVNQTYKYANYFFYVPSLTLSCPLFIYLFLFHLLFLLCFCPTASLFRTVFF